MKCTSCHSKNVKFIYRFSNTPTLNNTFFKTRAAAQRAAKGTIALYGCNTCRFIFNASFDERRARYSTSYDNTQSSSPYFSSYMNVLARRLVKKYALKGKRVIEVGCGKGQFLELLYNLGVTHVRGFDPAYVNYKPRIDRLVTKKYFNNNTVTGKVDVIVCRHTLEHIPHPKEFVESISECLAEDGVMYFEVPDVSWVVKHKTFFDYTYEHCNYFTPHSLYNLFAQFGFRHIVLRRGLSGQYIQAEIRKGAPDKKSGGRVDFRHVRESIDASIQRMSKQLKRLGTFVVWGAGGKGVLFLNRLRIDTDVSANIIDINRNKQGKYIPGTAQRVTSPALLRSVHLDTIIIMNPVYEKEIRLSAKKHGFRGNFLVV